MCSFRSYLSLSLTHTSSHTHGDMFISGEGQAAASASVRNRCTRSIRCWGILWLDWHFANGAHQLQSYRPVMPDVLPCCVFMFYRYGSWSIASLITSSTSSTSYSIFLPPCSSCSLSRSSWMDWLMFHSIHWEKKKLWLDTFLIFYIVGVHSYGVPR